MSALQPNVSRPSVLRVTNLTVRRGRAGVVRRVDLDFPEVGVVAVLGRNGSGRTTLLEGIAGLLPTDGSIRVDGVRLDGSSAVDRARRGVVLAPQRGAVFPGLTVDEHLRLAGGADWRSHASSEFTPTVEALCLERAGQRAETLSGGERRLLALAMVTLRRPRVALVDEPSEGVASALIPEIALVIRRLGTEALVLLADQNDALLPGTAERGFILDRGEAVHHGRFPDLQSALDHPESAP